jgi:hypothetical protein
MKKLMDQTNLAVYFVKTAKIEIESKINKTPAQAGFFHFRAYALHLEPWKGPSRKVLKTLEAT